MNLSKVKELVLHSFLKSRFQVHCSSYFARNLLLEIKTTNVNKSHFQGKCMGKSLHYIRLAVITFVRHFPERWLSLRKSLRAMFRMMNCCYLSLITVDHF